MENKSTLGLAVITHNEAHNIEACLQSVPFASEIVVVDSHSTDETVALAKKCNAKVFVRDWPGYGRQKQFALEQMTTDWVLLLDADEFLTSETRKAIQEVIACADSLNGYIIPGHQVFMGRTLHHGRGVDNAIRLVRRGKARWDDAIIHEQLTIEGKLGVLNAWMLHHSSPTIKMRLDKIAAYSELEMFNMREGQYRSSFKTIFIDPLMYFARVFFVKRAWKDGIPGLIWLGLFCYEVFILHAKNFERAVNPEVRDYYRKSLSK
ncbi:MAG: hypothetical protein A2X86_00040 [Bdellovibrionales bacterium GWA2_49_15]|nr:MAG: hypothetical protein A2X86_00040 [Bdellovibrionales bacterium GWA2_49_15]